MEQVPPNKAALAEALSLSSEILKNIELGEISLTNIALKTLRLARLLNDFDFQKIMEYEAGGYPKTATGIDPDIWKLGVISGRVYEEVEKKTNQTKAFMFTASISQLEDQLRTWETSLNGIQEPNSMTTDSWANKLAQDRRSERTVIRGQISETSGRLAAQKKFIYQYVMQKHYELKYSGISDDIFARIRQAVDEKIGLIIPDAVQKFTAIYDNLQSENPEDWSNAVHGCRRLLQGLADAIFKPIEDRIIPDRNKPIKLGKENYINRIIAFVQDNSTSERFNEIVGSQLDYLGNRLDSIYEASNKGSHETIISREEADRYVVYSYLLIGDILSLIPNSTNL